MIFFLVDNNIPRLASTASCLISRFSSKRQTFKYVEDDSHRSCCLKEILTSDKYEMPTTVGLLGKQPITLQRGNWTISPTWDQRNELFGPVLLIKASFLKLFYHPLILNCGTNVSMSYVNPDLYLFLNE